jgi:hypothetical protein
MGFRPPMKHATLQIGEIGKSVLLQNGDGLGRAATGPADRDDRAVAAQFTGATRKFAKRD